MPMSARVTHVDQSSCCTGSPPILTLVVAVTGDMAVRVFDVAVVLAVVLVASCTAKTLDLESFLRHRQQYGLSHKRAEDGEMTDVCCVCCCQRLLPSTPRLCRRRHLRRRRFSRRLCRHRYRCRLRLCFLFLSSSSSLLVLSSSSSSS